MSSSSSINWHSSLGEVSFVVIACHFPIAKLAQIEIRYLRLATLNLGLVEANDTKHTQITNYYHTF